MEEKCTLDNCVQRCKIFIFGRADCEDCKKAMCAVVHKNRCFAYCPTTGDYKEMYDEAVRRIGQKTVPLVYMHGQHIGGLHELEEALKKLQ
jgi:glutaredoxin